MSVDELITGVNIALERAPITQCPAADLDGSETISIDELVTAVNRALTSLDQQRDANRVAACLSRSGEVT